MKAGTGAPLRAALSKRSLTGPRLGRIGEDRQDFLPTVAELFNRENHCFLLDSRDPHSADGLTDPYLVLLLRREIAQNRNRVLSASVECDGDKLQVVQ